MVYIKSAQFCSVVVENKNSTDNEMGQESPEATKTALIQHEPILIQMLPPNMPKRVRQKQIKFKYKNG
jgi:hypothetical protein